MLDAFKSKGGATKVQSDELQTLIASSKEERAAHSTMLTQVQLHSAKLASAGKVLQEVEEKAGKANARLDEVNGRLSAAAARVTELEAMDARVKTLSEAVGRAEREALRLVPLTASSTSTGKPSRHSRRRPSRLTPVSRSSSRIRPGSTPFVISCATPMPEFAHPASRVRRCNPTSINSARCRGSCRRTSAS